MGLTDREAAPLMRACTGKVTTDTTNPVTVEVQDEAWMRAVCAPIMLAGRLTGILCAGGGDQWNPAPHSGAGLRHMVSHGRNAPHRAPLLGKPPRPSPAQPPNPLVSPGPLD